MSVRGGASKSLAQATQRRRGRAGIQTQVWMTTQLMLFLLHHSLGDPIGVKANEVSFFLLLRESSIYIFWNQVQEVWNFIQNDGHLSEGKMSIYYAWHLLLSQVLGYQQDSDPTGGCAGLDWEWNDMPPGYDGVNLKTELSSTSEVPYPQKCGFNWSGMRLSISVF